MTILLYLNRAENNRVDKTSYLELVRSMEGALRDSSSLLTPVITFELPPLSDSALIDEDDEEVESPDSDIVIAGSTVFEFNYVYIPEFNRYYFVNDIVIQRTKIYIVSLTVDVLMSYKDALFALDGYIERNEYNHNALIVDPYLHFEEEASVTIEQAERGDVQFSTDINWLDDNFVVNMIVCDTNFQGLPIEKPWSTTEKIYPRTFQGGNAIPSILNASKISTILYRAVKGQNGDNVSDFVLSVLAFPFNVPKQSNVLYDVNFEDSSKVVKTIADNNLQGYRPKAITSDYLVVGYVNVPSVASFMDLPPYKRVEIYLPFFGWHELDVEKLNGHRLVVYYVCNYQTGAAMVYVHDVNTSSLVFSTSCQLGHDIPVTKTNLQELEVRKNALNSQLAINLISSALSAGIGAGTGNPFMSANSIVSGAKAITSYINQNAAMFHHASVSFAGGAMALYSPLRVQVRTTVFNPTDNYDALFAKQYGKPLHRVMTLGILSGFTVVSSIHLENMSASKREKDEIERLLKSGVIL